MLTTPLTLMTFPESDCLFDKRFEIVVQPLQGSIFTSILVTAIADFFIHCCCALIHHLFFGVCLTRGPEPGPLQEISERITAIETINLFILKVLYSC